MNNKNQCLKGTYTTTKCLDICIHDDSVIITYVLSNQLMSSDIHTVIQLHQQSHKEFFCFNLEIKYCSVGRKMLIEFYTALLDFLLIQIYYKESLVTNLLCRSGQLLS